MSNIELIPLALPDHVWVDQPMIRLRGEREHTAKASAAIRQLQIRADRFRAGVTLGEFANDQRRLARQAEATSSVTLWGEWANCGYAAAAMAAHDWEKAFDQLRASIRTNPAIGGAADGTFKEVGRRFRATFPHARGTRDSVAHPEEYIKRDNSVGESGAAPLAQFGMMVSGTAKIGMEEGVVGGFFTTTFDGNLYQTPVTQAAADEINDLTSLLFSALEGLSNV